jgi:Raf kinase inhibitor-like YbhB/YbcL family protein
MTITSSAIQANGNILPQYTADGANMSPPLTFSEIPIEAKSLVLIVDDPDAPGGTFTHWLLYDMPSSILAIPENEMPQIGKCGANDFGTVGYGGPKPPEGQHRYYFKLFALDTMLELPEGVSRQEVEEAMQDHVVSNAELVGLYAKSDA